MDEAEETEEEGNNRPIRASSRTESSSSASVTVRKRVRARARARSNRSRGNDDSNDGNTPRGRVIQKRRLSSQSHRPTRAPLFEASPEDPFNELNGASVEPETHYGHSHSPPTRDPYYSPSKYEREKQRQKAKLSNDGLSYESGSGSTELVT